MGNENLLVTGGEVFDGLGGQPYRADIAIRNGQIVAVGTDISAAAGSDAQVIDAQGAMVTPGFVDIHTHYDGQVTWTNRVSPSSAHGITTIVMGSCGVGFAPCHSSDHDQLINLMSGVEDIPEVVMAEGLPWTWNTFPEFMDFLAARSYDMDIGALLPHSALRVYVMGERAVKRELANADDIEKMAALTREARAAGAVGFATSRALQQRSAKGEPIPTVRAGEDELLGIALALKDAGGGVLQLLSDFNLDQGIEEEFAMMRRLVKESRRLLSYTLHQKNNNPEGWRQLLALTEQANVDGLPIKAQVLSRPTGVLLGHELSYCPFTTSTTYQELNKLPISEKFATLRKPEIRARILGERPEALRYMPAMQDFERMFELGDPPQYEPAPDESIAARAKRIGCEPLELAYDLMLQRDGRAILFVAAQDYTYGSLEPTRVMLSHQDSLLGLGDGGAHVGIVCDASYSTHMLTHWTRDRMRGERLDLPTVVKWLSRDNAVAMGFNDRGVVAAGYKADLNVIDYDNLRLHEPEVVYDLPTGGRRVIQKASGYVATIVSGRVTYRDGQATGDLPGRLVRAR